MEKIKNIQAREILDSRGNPTVECDVELLDGSFGRAAVPSGASTGIHEALELRDGDQNRYLGKGVRKAVQNINELIKKNVLGKEFDSYKTFDKAILSLDGTENKSKIGANATLAASLAFAKSLADHTHTTFYQHIAESDDFLLPVPMMNIVNGGSHADNDVDIQEFMIAPVGANSFSESLRFGCEVFYSLKSILKSKNLNTNVGDEGGFAPNLNNSAEVIEIILSAIEKAGLKINDDILLSLDVASTEFYKNNKYELKSEGKTLTSNDMVSYIENLSNNFPIYSIEDGISEDDWDGWIELTKRIGNKVQLVGDDLFVTNIKRLKIGIEKNAANAILIKLNQIGTLTETIDAINLGKRNNYSSIISHRSGETEDTTIADLSVAVSAGQIKTGSLSRTDRTAKYNQLLRIEEMLGSNAKFAGKSILKY